MKSRDVLLARVEHCGGTEFRCDVAPPGSRSETTTSVAPNARTVCTSAIPIGPAPAIRTREPAVTPALRVVAMATDNGSHSAAASSDISSGIGCANAEPMVTYSASAPSIGGVA